MTEITTIMTADPTGEQLVLFARQAAERLKKDDLKRTQIRNIFTEVRKIEALWDTSNINAQRRLNMLKPKLDYQVERNGSVRYLRDILTEAITQVGAAHDDKTRNERFKRFVDLFEAILAYHRSIGGER